MDVPGGLWVRRAGALAVAVLGLGMGSGEAWGQRPGGGSGMGAGYFSAGVGWVDTEELDGRLSAAGYPVLGSAALTLGGGGYRLVGGGLLLGGSGSSVIAGEEAIDGRSVSVAGGYGTFDVGYLLPTPGNVRAYPVLGLGGGALALRIGAEATRDGFDAVLLAPGRQAVLARGSLLASLGVGVEVHPGEGPRGVLLGLRAGYLLAPFSASWRLDGTAVAEGPASSLAGPYLRLTIGGGRRR